MFNHIVFPTDTSDVSNSGFKVAVNIAHRYEGRITLLNIHQEFMTKEEMQNLRVSPQHYEEFMRDKAVKSREILQQLVKEYDVENISEILLRKGNPRKAICEVAEELKADIIVMTSNGRTNLREQLLGSVAEHVVHVSKIPILVVKV